MRRATLVLNVATLTLTLSLGACGDSKPGADTERSAETSGGKPDVVVVLIDTLRPDHLDLYGYKRETAPFLAELAASSTVFRRAWSTSSWTAPATASLFTSTYPTRHGVTRGFFATRDVQRAVTEGGAATLAIPRLPENRLTMPELFRNAGYRTFGLAANVNVGEEIGFERGFDRFERLHDLTEGGSPDAPELERKLLDWRREIEATDPAFVYLHFNDVHNPYQRNEPWYERFDDSLDDPMDDARARYDSEIREVDERLRRIFERFRWLDGGAKNQGAIVAVVSDHGEEFREHGGRFHRPSLYRELLQVVAVVRSPGQTSRTVDANVSLVDLLPTLLDLAGLPPTDDVDGVSLAPLVEGQSDALLDDRALYAHRQGARRSRDRGDEILESVVQGDLHLISRSDSVELFDLATDPDEQVDLAASRPDDAARLLDLLAGFASSEAASETSEIEVDAEAIEQLKTLGYIE